MNKYIDWRKLARRYVPILITIATLAISYLLTIKYGILYTLAPAFASIIIAIYYSGIAPGLISFSLIIGYSIIFISDPIRLLFTISSIVIIAIPVMAIQAYSRKIDTADAILKKMITLDATLLGAMIKWPDLIPDDHWNIVKDVHYKIADILNLVRGWHYLALERKQILSEEGE